MENLLTCPICYKTVKHPMSTWCHHLFSSLCIRKHLQFKQSCPSCHTELHEPQLRQDKTAEMLLPIFQALAIRVERILENCGGVSPCEVCKVEIPTKNLNLHTEKCRKSAKVGMKKESSFIRKRPPPLPKLVYSLLKETELKKKCKEFGLNPKGDRKLLESRLKKYTLLYNTELMLENPKSQLQIAMQVLKFII